MTMKNEKLDGYPVGYLLNYGADHLYSTGESLAQDEDLFILPNEFYIFKIKKNIAEARKRKRENDNPTTDNQRATLEFSLINFGDGTGIMNNGKTF